jgi:hypothetical protein
VPYWFNVIWSVVKNFVDPVTLEKISIVRGEKAIKAAMLERIPDRKHPLLNMVELNNAFGSELQSKS